MSPGAIGHPSLIKQKAESFAHYIDYCQRRLHLLKSVTLDTIESYLPNPMATKVCTGIGITNCVIIVTPSCSYPNRFWQVKLAEISQGTNPGKKAKHGEFCVLKTNMHVMLHFHVENSEYAVCTTCVITSTLGNGI